MIELKVIPNFEWQKKILQRYEENINEEVEEHLKKILNTQYEDLPHFLNKDLLFDLLTNKYFYLKYHFNF